MISKFRNVALVVLIAIAIIGGIAGAISGSKKMRENALSPTTFESVDNVVEVCVGEIVFGVIKHRKLSAHMPFSRPLFPIFDDEGQVKRCERNDGQKMVELGYKFVIGACIQGWKYARIYSYKNLQVIPLFEKCIAGSSEDNDLGV